MSQFIKVDFRDRKRLVEALLECACMRDNESRNQTLGALSKDVSSRIARSSMNYVDVDNIVSACFAFSGAFERLIEIVYYLEGSSDHAKELKRIVAEINSKLSEKTQTPRAPDSQNWLPYLCNRSAQEKALKEALRERRDSPTRPLLCVIHGDEYECHDMFIERLRTELLPEAFRLNVALEPFEWYDPPSPKSPRDQFWQNLGDKCVGFQYYSIEACRDLITKKLNSSESPLFINLGWLTENCEPCAAGLFDSFLQFWEELSELPANRLVICAISLTYQRSRNSSSRFGFKLKSPNEKLRLLVKRLQEKPFNKFTMAVLPELHAVTRGEAEAWPNHPKVRSRRRISKQAITEIYRKQQDRPIPMEVLAAILQEIMSAES